jgi:hypothetical protein
MLSIIVYLLCHAGFAWSKKILGFHHLQKEIPSLVISLNFDTKNNNLISAELEKVLWHSR